MADVKAVVKDPKFRNLPYEEKRKVLQAVDANFAALPVPEQTKVMNALDVGAPTETPIRQAVSEFARPALQAAGGVAGAVLGAGAGAPTIGGVPVGAAAGGALGMAAGNEAANILDEKLGLKDAPVTVGEAAAQGVESLKTGAAAEAMGLGVTKALTTAAGPLAKAGKATHEAILKKAHEVGLELTPAEVTQSKTLSLLESLLDKLPFTSDMMKSYRLGQIQTMIRMRDQLMTKGGNAEAVERLGTKIQQAVDDTLRGRVTAGAEKMVKLKDNLLRKLGSDETYEEVGIAGREAILKQQQRHLTKAEALYDKATEMVDKKASGTMEGTARTAFKFLKQEEALKPSQQDPELLKTLKDFANRGTPLTWQQMRLNKSALGAKIAEHDKAAGAQSSLAGAKMLSDRAAGVYKQLFKSMNNDMARFAESQAPGAKQALDAANLFYKEGIAKFNRPAVLKVLRSSKDAPNKIVDVIFRPNSSSEIKALREVLGEKEFRPLKKKFVNKLLDTKSGEPITGPELRRHLHAYGDETIGTIFSQSEVKQLQQFADNLEKVDKSMVQNPFFKTILKASPEKVVGFIVKPKNTTNVKFIQDELGEAGMEPLRQGFIQKLLLEGQDATNFQPTKIKKLLEEYGDDTLNAVFPKDVVKDLKTLAEVGSRLGHAERIAGNPSGTAQNIFTFEQGKAWLTNPVTGAKVLVPSTILGRMYMSAPVRKWLTEGFRPQGSSKEAAQLFSRLAAIAASQKFQAGEDDED